MTDTNSQLSFDVIVELQNAVQIMDYAADQGAFKGWSSINQVLACRGRLVAFIELMQSALHAETQNGEQSEIEEVSPPVVPSPTTEAVYEVENDEDPKLNEDAANAERQQKLTDIEQRRDEMLRELAKLQEEASNLN